MQNKLKFSNKYLSFGFKTLKLLFWLCLLVALYFQVIVKFKNFQWNSLHNLDIFFGVNIIYWILIGLLLILNWALEAKKWQILAQKIENISFFQAFKGVLVGLAFSNILVSIGDFAGKILMLHSDKRLQSIGAALVGNAIQLYVSLLFGFFGLLFFVSSQHPTPAFAFYVLTVFLGICVSFGLILGIYFDKSNALFLPKKIFKNYLKVLKEFSPKEIKRIFILSFFRYFVFSTQFYLILVIFQLNLPWKVLFSGIFPIFLGKTIGSLFHSLGDLSIRELSAVYFFSFYGTDIPLVSLATFMVWIINVLFPSLVGSFYVFQLKFSTNQLQSE